VQQAEEGRRLSPEETHGGKELHYCFRDAYGLGGTNDRTGRKVSSFMEPD